MQYFIAAAAMLMVVALALGVRHRKDQSLFYASIGLAVSFVTNLDEVFMPLDEGLATLTGRHNLLGLLGTCAMVVGVYFLAQAVLRASWTEERPGYETVFRISLFVVLAGMVTSFLFVDAPHSSLAFMREFGMQVPAAIYSMLQFGYIGVVMVVLAVFTYRASRIQRSHARLGSALVCTACAFAAIMVISVFGMDIANLTGDLSTLSIFASVYTPATILTMLFLCAGLSTFPIARSLQREKFKGQGSAVLSQLLSVHGKIKAGPMNTLLSQAELGKDTNFRIYRLVIETRDALLRDPHLEQRLTPEDHEVLRAAEEYLETATS